MSRILRQHATKRLTRTIRKGAIPSRITYVPGELPLVRFSDGGEIAGACISCPDTPCLEYSPKELVVGKVASFPADQSIEVCASGALHWNADVNGPVVDSSRCVMCGACALRCPVGAIGIDPDEGAVVNHEPNAYFVSTKTELTEQELRRDIAPFFDVAKEGLLVVESDTLVEQVSDLLSALTAGLGPQFPNHLCRNLLIALGMRTAMRRRGDVNLRMDLVFCSQDRMLGVGEVEFSGQSLLDSPRNALDNVAVLSNRYAVPREAVASLIVSLDLPNARAEYWRVVKDIANVLGIRIGSLTVPAMLMLIWNRANVAELRNAPFYADEDRPSIRAAVETLIGRRLRLSDGVGAAVEVAK